MSLLRKFAGQTIIYGLGNILPRIINFLVVSFYLTYRLEDSYEYGLFANMYAYSTVIIVILSYRIDTAFFRFGSKENQLFKAAGTAFVPLVFTTLLFVAAIVLFKNEIATSLKLADYPHYFQWFAIILGLDVLTLIPFAKMRLEGKAIKFMLFKVGNILVTISLLFYFFEFYDPGNNWLQSFFPSQSLEVEYAFIANMVASILLFIGLLSELKNINFSVDIKLWKKMILYSAPLIIVGLANSVNQFFSGPLQHFFLSGSYEENLAESGIYQGAMRLAVILSMFNTGFNYAAEPFFFNNASKTKDPHIYGQILSMYVITASIMIAGILCYLDVLQFLIGQNYRVAIYIVPYLLLAYMMLGIYYNVSIWYKLNDKTHYGSVISIIGTIATLIISIALLPILGYVASAIAALVCYTVMVIIAYYTGQVNYKINYNIRHVISIILSIIVLIIFIHFVNVLGMSLINKLILKTLIFLLFSSGIIYANKSLLLELVRSKSS